VVAAAVVAAAAPPHPPPCTRTGFGWTLTMLTSVHTYVWTVMLQHMAFPASTSCVMITWVGEQTQRWRGRQTWPCTSTEFTKGHTANRTVLSFFYVDSIGEPGKPNVL